MRRSNQQAEREREGERERYPMLLTIKVVQQRLVISFSGMSDMHMLVCEM